MLTKEIVILNKYKPWNLSIPKLCDTVVELYVKLEFAVVEFADLLSKKWEDEQDLKETIKELKTEAELVELQKSINKIKLTFIRFGDLPDKSKNHLTGKFEAGVSVYEGIERNGVFNVIIPSLTGSVCVSLSGCITRTAYEVSGTIIGYGSDGEPLLSNCKKVKILSKNKTGNLKGI